LENLRGKTMQQIKFLFGLLTLIVSTVLITSPSFAQSASPKPVRAPCGAGFVHNQPNFNTTPLLHRASFQLADVQAGALRLTFIGHASFLIESPQGVKVITDYNDYFRAKVIPDIATMNIDRGNHSTETIEPSIKYALRGWDTGKGIPRHDVAYKDVRVYNLPTNLTDFGTSFTNFSSMFVFQSGGICVGHMGHLRHILDQKAFAKIGRIDVLLVPIDGRVTQSMGELVHNIKGIRPRLIVPMHFNAMFTAEEFLTRIKGTFPVKRTTKSSIVLSRATLPQNTEVLLMSPTIAAGEQF
jgi:L-ascorbate metabolism protein UlaG (beta-lactamase superfamily)